MELDNWEKEDSKCVDEIVREKECPICHNKFPLYCLADDYGWRLNHKLYCSYKCMRVDEKRIMEEKNKKMLDKQKLDNYTD